MGHGSTSAALRCALLTLAIPARSKCWGRNQGQLGLGDTNNRGFGANEMGTHLPSVDLGSGWTVVEVAAGNSHTCARLEDGAARALKCWGSNNFYGRLGMGDSISRGGAGGEMGDLLPAVQLGTGRWALALDLGIVHSCALLDDGASFKCWGDNDKGQLGLGDVETRGDRGGEMGDDLPSVPLCLGPCPAGYSAWFTGADGWACVACEAGTYAATSGLWTCAVCPSH